MFAFFAADGCCANEKRLPPGCSTGILFRPIQSKDRTTKGLTESIDCDDGQREGEGDDALMQLVAACVQSRHRYNDLKADFYIDIIR